MLEQLTEALLQFLFLCFNSRLVGKFRRSNKTRWNSGADWAHSCEVGEYITWRQQAKSELKEHLKLEAEKLWAFVALSERLKRKSWLH